MTESADFGEKRSAAAQIFKDMALEMLELAALDLSRPLPDALDRTTAASRSRADRLSAQMWIEPPGTRGVVTFALCCDALNVPVEALRAAMIERPSHILAEVRAAMEHGTGPSKRQIDFDEPVASESSGKRLAFSRP